MDRGNKAILILSILTVIFTIMGGTLAYWNWQSSSEQKTNVTFTVASGFSCSADGGGSITSNDKVLAPAACTNTTYAIKRTITVKPTITQPNKTIYLDMWLKVKNIGEGLSNSVNMRYALTDSETNCTTGVVATGNFNGATTNTEKTLLHEKEYSSTTTETYYLWIWLDSAETNSNTMNQTFNIELGGNCTDEAPNYVYTANIYDENVTGNNFIWTGQAIPNTITKFYDPNGPSQAMTALETAYSNANSGATANLPFFLRHRIGDGTLWCANGEGNSDCIYQTQTECNSEVEDDYGSGYTCQQNTFTNGVSESYVGFVVTPTMANVNSSMTAGTYYLKGGDNGRAYNENKSTLLRAFGSANCTDYSSYFYCTVSGLSAYADSHGGVYVYAADYVSSRCEVDNYGISDCYVNS